MWRNDLKIEYQKRVLLTLLKEFGYKNRFQVPRMEKIVINVGLGEGVQDRKVVEIVKVDLASIAGQQPVVTRAKKSISNFKLRKGMPIGCKVTLRGEWMYDFLQRLIYIAIPRIRDFRGLSRKSFDGRGNYTFGVDEQIIFPEIHYDKLETAFGMDITFVTTAQSDEEGYALLRELGLPYQSD
ncbi:50S ribosomal protein L5 [candidate division TA06 bacterium]|nr:50S ribosomal protein L5 [candidate division TA06 bacterium]